MAAAAAAVLLDPLMRICQPSNASLGDYVNMGIAGAIAIHAVVVGGGRIVQAVYNKFTKKRELFTDVDGNFVDYPALTWEPPTQPDEVQQAQQELAKENFEDKPTTPRPQLP